MEQIFTMGLNVQELIEQITDLCFPPSPEVLLVRSLSAQSIESFTAPRTVGSVTALAAFEQTEIRALIHEAKYHGNARAQALLGHLLNTFLKMHPELAEAIWVPVPLSRARLRSRGYNQIGKVLEKAQSQCEYSPFEIDTHSLVRARDTRPQTELTRTDRLLNMKDAFTTSHPERFVGKDIVLIDDVVTTGATLKAAEEALLKANPRIITVLALAH